MWCLCLTKLCNSVDSLKDFDELFVLTVESRTSNTVLYTLIVSSSRHGLQLHGCRVVLFDIVPDRAVLAVSDGRGYGAKKKVKS